jgi:hypothetical protein
MKTIKTGTTASGKSIRLVARRCYVNAPLIYTVAFSNVIWFNAESVECAEAFFTKALTSM